MYSLHDEVHVHSCRDEFYVALEKVHVHSCRDEFYVALEKVHVHSCRVGKSTHALLSR